MDNLSHDFDRLAPVYDKAIRILLFPLGGEKRLRLNLVKEIEKLNLKRGARILEIGCGTGENLRLIDSKYPAKYKLICVDISGKMLEQAKNKSFHSPPRFLNVGSDSIPLSEDSIDVVITSFFLHELNPELRNKTFSQIRKLLKKKGSLIILDFSYPNNIPGKFLFKLLRIIESRESLNFVTGEIEVIPGKSGFYLKNKTTCLAGLVSIWHYTQDSNKAI